MESEKKFIKQINLYFEYFSEKNIEALCNLFTKEVKLRDWEINESGIIDVKNALISIFKNVVSIKIKPLNIIYSDYRGYCEIDIIINSSETLKVVDIIDFNEKGLISSIKAFKG